MTLKKTASLKTVKKRQNSSLLLLCTGLWLPTAHAEAAPAGKLSAMWLAPHLSLSLSYTIFHLTAASSSSGAVMNWTHVYLPFIFWQVIPDQCKKQLSCAGGRSLKDPKRRNEHFLMILCLPSKQQEEVALLSPLLSPSLSIFGSHPGAHTQSNLVRSKIILWWWYNS